MKIRQIFGNLKLLIFACMATGQAAGTALALSVKHKCLAEKIDINELLDELRKQKALV